MTKRVSAVAIQALKEALYSIYWYKRDLRSFLQNSIIDKSIVNNVNWDNYKRQIVSDVVDALCDNQDKYLGDIRRLFHEVCKINSFYHLEQLEDGKRKAEQAKIAVDSLRRLVDSHDQATRESDKAEERKKHMAERLNQSKAVRDKLEEIKNRYMALITTTEAQKRGYELEKILHELFTLFDLDPKASFKNIGEQIDGAFNVDSTFYLFEAKWQKDLVGIQQLDAFAPKVKRKLENTLGLFLSINGFSQDGVSTHSIGRPVIILMTGSDLMAVLEERIDLDTLIQRKRRHAVHTGNIQFQAHEMLS